jgi:hypothetical protein
VALEFIVNLRVINQTPECRGNLVIGFNPEIDNSLVWVGKHMVEWDA